MSKTINQYWQAGVESAKLIIGGQIEVKTECFKTGNLAFTRDEKGLDKVIAKIWSVANAMDGKGTNSISHRIKWLLSSDTAPGILSFSYS